MKVEKRLHVSGAGDRLGSSWWLEDYCYCLDSSHVPGASFMYNSSLKLIWAALSSVEAPCFPFFPD
jgi:hypothetical protein